MTNIEKIKNHPYLSDKYKLAAIYVFHREDLDEEEKVTLLDEIQQDRELMNITLDIFTEKEDAELDSSDRYLDSLENWVNFIKDIKEDK